MRRFRFKIIALLSILIIGLGTLTYRTITQQREPKHLEQAEIDRQLEKGLPFAFPRGASQTEGWLSQVSWQEVKKRLYLSDNELDDLKQMTYETIIPREKEHANNYFAFYHAQERIFWLFYEFQKQLYERLHHTKLDHFYFLRDLSTFIATDETIQEWLAKKSFMMTRTTFDHLRHIKAQLLSTNVALPGNLNSGESSADYYLNSRSMTSPIVSTLLYNTIITYVPKEPFLPETQKIMVSTAISELERIADHIINDKNNKYGLLLTLFIPNYIVDSAAYMSTWGGHPIGEGYYVGLNLPSEVLSALMHQPAEINNIKDLQARLRLSDALFADPQSGIKMFIDQGIAPDNLAQYKQQIAQVVDQLVSVPEIETIKKREKEALKKYEQYEVEEIINRLKQITEQLVYFKYDETIEPEIISYIEEKAKDKNPEIKKAVVHPLYLVTLRSIETIKDLDSLVSFVQTALDEDWGDMQTLEALSILEELIKGNKIETDKAMELVQGAIEGNNEDALNVLIALADKNDKYVKPMIVFMEKLMNTSNENKILILNRIKSIILFRRNIDPIQLLPLIEKGIKDSDPGIRNLALLIKEKYFLKKIDLFEQLLHPIYFYTFNKYA